MLIVLMLSFLLQAGFPALSASLSLGLHVSEVRS